MEFAICNQTAVTSFDQFILFLTSPTAFEMNLYAEEIAYRKNY